MVTRTPHFEDDPVHDSSAQNEKTTEEKAIRRAQQKKWTLGILADHQTAEVPGTVLLLSKFSTQNIPLGLEHEHDRGRRRSRSRGSISGESDRRVTIQEKKKTPDGQVILEPQPDDSANDPLNWQLWRRDAALMSLGFYCMIGGGMTPILAAGFNQVSGDLGVSYADIARTTGLYMMGLGVGCVFASPTAILFGKRPVYLLSAILFIVSSIWCALAPNYANLATARVFQGMSVSPVECLPSATVAEIFFLHERAFRLGIYTLLLLGGKNLVPLVSAAVMQSLGWRWVFWIVAIIVGFGGFLLFLFVPETFWDRTPRPKALTRRSTSRVNLRHLSTSATRGRGALSAKDHDESHRFRFGKLTSHTRVNDPQIDPQLQTGGREEAVANHDGASGMKSKLRLSDLKPATLAPTPSSVSAQGTLYSENDPSVPQLHNLNSPYYVELEKTNSYLDFNPKKKDIAPPSPAQKSNNAFEDIDIEKHDASTAASVPVSPVLTMTQSRQSSLQAVRHQTPNYTTDLRSEPAKPWGKSLRVWNGRLNKVNWWRAAVRPAVLYAYPSVLWSAMVYSLSIGWLIVISESVSHIYATRDTYNFDSLQIGLVYLSPFIGGILGTAVAGKVSDVVVRFMARRNDGIYEPEYRLVMAIPIAISTAIGLMGFGWSAEEHDAWIVPTIFFGIISFGCSLGSTTAITFCVDSYRQYAGEALVTLNFSKNIFHGLVWSLFFPQWLEADGSKTVFVAIGCVQLGCMLLTIPMYIFGKRARMWTVRKGFMDGL